MTTCTTMHRVVPKHVTHGRQKGLPRGPEAGYLPAECGAVTKTHRKNNAVMVAQIIILCVTMRSRHGEPSGPRTGDPWDTHRPTKGS